ncbi:AGAP007997-PA [Anopheles gambiae str. PEST]|nr:AGAP007997-PA [Anopheles gambiae str. PEST]
MPSTMPAIVETSGVSVNSMIDGGNFAGHLDDAEEARENDEELEALERMVELRRFSREEAQATLLSNEQHDKIVPAKTCTPSNVLHHARPGAAETTDRNNTNRTSSTGAGAVNNVEPVASSKPIKP